MKKTTLVLASLLMAAHCAFAQIPNASFESWDNSAGYNVPDSWANMNAMTAPMSVYTAQKGTPGVAGSASYLKLTSKTVSGMGVMPGIAATGTINASTMAVTGGFANATRPANLTGSWQYMGGSASDQGFVAAYLTKWNAVTMQRDTVATAMEMLSGMAMSWSTFSIPFTYNEGFNPDTALIILSSSGMAPVANSYLYVDNLAFSGSVAATGIATLTTVQGLAVYPNPARQRLAVSFTAVAAKEYTIQLTDALGRVMLSQPMKAAQGQNKETIDVSGLPAGSYQLSIWDGSASQSQSVVLQ